MGEYFWYVKIAQCGYMEHGLKDIEFDVQNSTTICKLVDLIPALRQSDCRIPNWVSAKTVLSCSTNHGQ